MAEQLSLTMEAGTDPDEYIDLSSALTAVNRKQYHQTSRKGVPLCYYVTLHFDEGAQATDRVRIVTAPNNWTVRNSVVKLSAAWKKQLKSAGIRMKDLSKYGRRLRMPLRKNMSSSGTGGMYGVMMPIGWDSEDGGKKDMFTDYTTPAGDTVTYESANEFTRLAIPDADGGDSLELNVTLMGPTETVAANSYFGVVDQYLGSRGGIIDEPGSAQQTPDADNLLQTLFSSTQPSTDEVIEAVEDYAEFRPYNDGELDSSATPVTDSDLSSRCESVTVLSPNHPTSEGNGKSSVTFHAPLGLIWCKGAINKCIFQIDIHAIYEM